MAAFRFRLERILKHSERAKQAALGELSRSQQAKHAQEQELTRLVAARLATGAARLPVGEACSSARLQTIQVRLEKLSGDIGRQSEAVQNSALEVEAKRAGVVERRRQTLKLIALRDRRKALWRRTRLRLEQAAIDDIASTRELARRRAKPA